MTIRAWTCGTLLGAIAAAPRPAPAATPAALLAQAKQAHGGAAWDKVDTLVLEGTTQENESAPKLDGETWEDLPRGRYLRWYGSGDALRWWSFDGESFRMQTGLGAPYSVDGELRERVARTCAYMHSRGYWFPDRFPATFAYTRTQTEQGRLCHVIWIKPKGALPLECWIDSEQSRVCRIDWTVNLRVWCYQFEDFREVEGLLLPHRLLCGWQGEPSRTRTEVKRYHFRSGFPQTAFTCGRTCEAKVLPEHVDAPS